MTRPYMSKKWYEVTRNCEWRVGLWVCDDAKLVPREHGTIRESYIKIVSRRTHEYFRCF